MGFSYLINVVVWQIRSSRELIGFTIFVILKINTAKTAFAQKELIELEINLRREKMNITELKCKSETLQAPVPL